jgi:acylphosphatase
VLILACASRAIDYTEMPPSRQPNMDSNSTIRRIIYHGRVQGVGFRATTEHIARPFAVTGYVRNLADGTVEMVASGAADEVARFLGKVSGQFGPNITRVEEVPAPQEWSGEGFIIRY